MTLYVDDGLIACKRKETLNVFVSLLISRFEVTCHESSCYVGMEISQNRKSRTLYVNQQRYISRMLHRFGMKDCKSVTSPMDFSIDLTEINEEKNEEKHFPYRKAIGCLNYIAIISRPDISCCKHACSIFK